MGILGAVLATSASYIIVVIVRIFDTKKIMKINIGILDLVFSSGILMFEVYFAMVEKQSLLVFSFVILLIWKAVNLKYANNHM